MESEGEESDQGLTQLDLRSFVGEENRRVDLRRTSRDEL